MFTLAWKGWRWLAIGWLLVISVLFFLPGSAFPKEDWLSAVYFDKWVHTGFFAVLLFLWRALFPTVKKWSYQLFAVAVLYGFGVEVVQHYFISNRSFDLGDVAADTFGAFVGLYVWSRVYTKK